MTEKCAKCTEEKYLSDLEKIPLKYRKGFPEIGEEPFFKTKKFLPSYPKVVKLSGARAYLDRSCEIQMPTDPEEYKKASKRIKELATPERVNHFLNGGKREPYNGDSKKKIKQENEELSSTETCSQDSP